MGQRGELFSTRVLLQNRTYFFNVKENRMGDLYLNIVESKNREDGAFDRQSVILFADDLQEFLKGFDDSLRILEKEIRERRRTTRAERGPRDERNGRDARDSRDSRGAREEKGRPRNGDRGEGFGGRPRTDDRRPGQDRPRRDRPSGKEDRRVVVKKR